MFLGIIMKYTVLTWFCYNTLGEDADFFHCDSSSIVSFDTIMNSGAPGRMEVSQCNKKMEGKSTCIRIYIIYKQP